MDGRSAGSFTPMFEAPELQPDSLRIPEVVSRWRYEFVTDVAVEIIAYWRQ